MQQKHPLPYDLIILGGGSGGLTAARLAASLGARTLLIEKGHQEEIVGAHLVEAHVGELLGELALAMHQHLPLSAILATIHPYPTWSTGLQQLTFEAYLQGAGARHHRTFVQALLALRQTFARLFARSSHRKEQL